MVSLINLSEGSTLSDKDFYLVSSSQIMFFKRLLLQWLLNLGCVGHRAELPKKQTHVVLQTLYIHTCKSPQ